MRNATTVPSRSIGRFKQSERKPINAKGYRFRIKVRNAVGHGGIADGGNMLVGDGVSWIELCIGSVNSNAGLKLNGGALRNMKDPQYAGESIAELMVDKADVHAMEHNKNFCYGGVLYSRGVLNGIPTYSAPYSTATFTAAGGGSFYIEPGGKYLFHHPTTYAAHGGAVAFECFDKPTKLTARFIGDVTAATSAADGDLVVPLGSETAGSSINKGVRGLSYFTAETGDYFGADRDVEDRIRGIRKDASSDMITPQLLDYVDTLYMIKWPDDNQGTMGHSDFIPPCQDAAMKFNAYPLWRLDEQNYRNYDPQSKFKSVGGREKVIDVHYPDTNWFRVRTKDIYHYVQRDWDLWDYDGQDSRAVPANSSILDAIQLHFWSTDQYGCEEPGHQIEIYGLGTTGTALKVS
jgi:hypothetical protein